MLQLNRSAAEIYLTMTSFLHVMVMPAINQPRTHHFLATDHYQQKPRTTVISPRDAECRRPEPLITNTGLASQLNTAHAVKPLKSTAMSLRKYLHHLH